VAYGLSIGTDIGKTLNDLERRNSLCFVLFHQIR